MYVSQKTCAMTHTYIQSQSKNTYKHSIMHSTHIHTHQAFYRISF